MITRLGDAGDFQAILPMLQQYRSWQQQLDPALYALHPDAESRFRLWVARMAEDPRSTLVVAEDQDRLIGFVIATIERDPPVYLYEEFRGRARLVGGSRLPPPRRGQGADRARCRRPRQRRGPASPHSHRRPRRRSPHRTAPLRLPPRRERDVQGVVQP